MRQRIPLETREDELDEVLRSLRQERLETANVGDATPGSTRKRPLRHITIIPRRHIPFKRRIKLMAISLVLIIHGVIGIMSGSLLIPGKGIARLHLTGIAMWIGFAAIIFGAMHFLSIAASHYDKRDNEIHYSRFANMTTYAGWTLLLCSVVAHAFLEAY